MMLGSSDPAKQNLGRYVGPGLSVNIDGLPMSPPSAIPVSVCDLSDVVDSGGNVTGWAHNPKNSVGIDPVLGRIAFPANLPAPTAVHVDYCYGFSTEMGGGSYSRPGTLTPDSHVKVPAGATTLQAALTQVMTDLADPEKKIAVIEVSDNEYYPETLTVTLGKDQTLEIRGADGFRPVLLLSGDMNIVGDGNSVFRMDGFLV